MKLLTAKIGGGPKKNFPPQHKKGIIVRNPDTTTEWTPIDPKRIPPFSGVHPAKHLSSTKWLRAKSTH